VSKRRDRTWVALIALAVGVLLVAILGRFAYISATSTPLHPDARSVPSAVQTGPAPQWAAAVEQGRQIVRAGITEQNLPGLSVAVGLGRDIVWAEGFGWADLDRRIPVAPRMRFRIAQVSNTLTSAGVGLLLEQGKLNLDAEIQTYVPEFPKKPWPVTLRQLMGQVAGIRNDAGDEESLDPCEKTAEGLERFADDALLFEPGSRFRPSTYGWILVSAAVEAAADEPFFRFMRTRLFEPLGMTSTTPDSAIHPAPDQPIFYYPRFAGDTRYGPELAREGDHSCFAGGGAFLSTPSDMVRFGAAVSRGTLLQPATVQVLQARQRLTSGQYTDYGLGWQVETVPLAGGPTRMASHGTKQDFIGGTASLLTFPERGIVVAMSSNIAFADTRSVALKVAQAFAAPGTSPAHK
jgi:serine beta-lactamase-like protein LACTB, mitochondrial